MPENKIVLQNCGLVDPQSIESYMARNGFKALHRAVSEMGPEGVIAELKQSGLRGRGGAGFPTGMKWEFTRKAASPIKYLICNADEGEMGTFKDRYILERDPFSLVEGIAIAGHAIGVRKAYIYLRTEYHRLLPLLQNALAQARQKGGVELDIEVCEGAGAYVCGEESALMESIEGKRGEPRYRPPFPPEKGLFGEPTTINNVETLMNIPRIILGGGEWFNRIGTEQSKGTKVFSVSGDVERPGVYELVMGTPLRELVQDLAGGRDINMVQIGGASGRVLPGDKLDTPLSFETVLGAGAVMAYNGSRDVLDIARRTVDFFVEESCGKCTPCREGTLALVGILERLCAGEGRAQDLEDMKALASCMRLASLCGLGQAAPNVVVDTMQYFPSEYQARANGAKVCT